MPKRKRQPEAEVARPAPRRSPPRLTAERRGQTLVVAAVIAVVIAALGIVAFGYYQTSIAPKGEAVLKVEDRSFSLRYFERRARYEVRNGNPALFISGSQITPDNIIAALRQDTDTLVSIVELEELIRLGAADEGIVITDEDIEDEIRSREGVSEEADSTAFAVAYRAAVQDSGLATSDFRDLIAAELLEDRLREKFQDEVPSTTEQVSYRLIQVATAEEAEAILQRLDDGEDFIDLAVELSTDIATAALGGDFGWTAVGALPDDIKADIDGLEPGEYSGVIERHNSAVIVRVEQRDADREVTEEQQGALAVSAFDDWLEDLRGRTAVLVLLDDEQTASIVGALLDAP